MARTLLTGNILRSGSIPTTALGGGVVSSSAQIISSLPTGVLSSSAQVNYPDISNIPGGIASSSAQVIAYLPTDTVSSSGQVTAFLPTGTVSSSTQLPNGIASSSAQVTAYLPTGTVSSSGQISVFNTINGDQLATTGSNTFTAPQTISDTTNSTSYLDGALHVAGGMSVRKDVRISGSMTINGLLTAVSMSTQYVTSSQYVVGTSRITLNDDDNVRFAGLSIIDSGSSSPTSASIFWDSLQHRFIYENLSGSAYNSSIIIAGPKHTGSLGDEPTLISGYIPYATGTDHIDNSVMFQSSSRIGIGITTPSLATLQINGNLHATSYTGSLSGSSVIVNNLTGTLQTAAQTNVTSVGTLSSLTVSGNLTVDTNTLFVDSVNNRVGVGTTSPGHRLSVDGGRATIVPNSEVYALYMGYNSSTAGVWLGSPVANTLAFYRNDGFEHARIDASGNLGVGTTSPTAYGAGYRTISANGTSSGVFEIRANDVVRGLIVGDATDLQIQANGATPMRLFTNSTERARIDASGNFGIGTTAPAYKLDVNGKLRTLGILNSTDITEIMVGAVVFANNEANRAFDIRFGNTSFWGYLEVEITSTFNFQNSPGKLTKIFSVGTNPNNLIYSNESRIVDAMGPITSNIAIGEFGWDAANSTYRIPVSHIVSTGNMFSVRVKMFSLGNGAQTVFDNISLSSVYTLTALSRHYPYYNERLGIGTASPNGLLSITPVSTGTRKIVLYDGGVNNNFQFYGFGIEDSTLLYSTYTTSDDHVFFAGTGTSTRNELMRVKGNGNVGIGTTSPTTRLTVRPAAANTSVFNVQAATTSNNLFNVISNGAEGHGILDIARNSESGTYSPAHIRLRTDGDSWIQGGNVGIGTTSPEYPLQVRRAGGAGSLGISIDGVGSTDRTVQYFAIQDNATGVGAGHAWYYRAPSSTTNTFGMILDEAGNVGIGTTSPTSKLQVAGGIAATGYNEPNARATVIGADSNNALVYGRNGASGWSPMYLDATTLYINAQTGGNVGIGTASPQTKLDVTGRIQSRYSNTVSLSSTATTTLASLPLRCPVIVSVFIYWNNNINGTRQVLLYACAADTGWGSPNSAITILANHDWSSGYVGTPTFTIGGSGQSRTLQISVGNAPATGTVAVTALASIIHLGEPQ